MIPAAHLEKLKRLFAEDGIVLTDAQALEIGLWLVAAVRPLLTPIPLDKAAQFATIRDETRALRQKTSFVNLWEWRRKQGKTQ